jgi:hypothetical protein
MNMSDDRKTVPESIARLRVLAGLTENESYLSRDEADEMDDAEYDRVRAREIKIVKLIDRVCRTLDLPVERENDGTPSGIYYDEAGGREASIRLEDVEITASTAARLLKSGLADDFRIIGRSTGIDIEFTVHQALDGAV